MVPGFKVIAVGELLTPVLYFRPDLCETHLEDILLD